MVLVGVVLAAVALMTALGAVSGLVVDLWWFRELGASVVFRTTLLAKIGCFAIGFAVAYAVLAAIGLRAVSLVRHAGVVRVVFRRSA